MVEITFKSLKDSLFETKDNIYAPNEGLKIICPQNGYLVVYDLNNYGNNPFEYSNDVVLAEKKRLFGKSNTGKYKIYSVSNGFIFTKGCTTKMGFDVTYSGVSVDIVISFDYSFGVARGRFSQFRSFIDSRSIGSESNANKYKEYLNPFVEKAIKKAVGDELRIKPIEDVETDIVNLSNQIKDILNSNQTELYDFGLEVKSFTMNIVDDYEHRQEKKKVEHDSALINRRP